mgnify:CR=1 FL=1
MSVLSDAVMKKWGNDLEFVGSWYAKFTAARRRHLQKLWDNNPHCIYCGVKTQHPGTNVGGFVATYEHLTPTVRGGTEARSNAGLSCRRCNSTKSHHTDSEFRLMIGNDPDGFYKQRKSTQQAKRIKRCAERNADPEVIAKRLTLAYCISLLMCDPEYKNVVDKYLKS